MNLLQQFFFISDSNIKYSNYFLLCLIPSNLEETDRKGQQGQGVQGSEVIDKENDENIQSDRKTNILRIRKLNKNIDNRRTEI